MKILEKETMSLFTVLFFSREEADIIQNMIFNISENMAISASAVNEFVDKSQPDFHYNINVQIPKEDYDIMLPILKDMIIERLERVM